MISRRRFIRGSAAGAAMTLAWPAHSLPSSSSDPRLILMVLRGGLDGLGAVPAYGDPDYRRARGGLADPVPGNGNSGGILDLDGFFGLHGRLEHMHRLFTRGDLAIVHAVAPPYLERSHFDGQDVLETGISDPSASTDGWLFRALSLLPGGLDPAQHAMAVGGPVPLVLRGAIPVSSWAPDRLPPPDDDTVRRLLALYAEDPLLGPRLEAGLATGQMLGAGIDRNGFGSRGNGLAVTVKATARFLSHVDGPRIAVLEEGGWDTHANQQGQLSNRLAGLDTALQSLESGLGAAWSQTVVLIVTEFGRTVAMNGTRGSDHGVGGVAFAAGGVVDGGRVLGEWPGLGRRDLYQGRDLMPTTDVRALFRAVLKSHLGLDEKGIDERVFPDSRLTGFDGLLRT